MMILKFGEIYDLIKEGAKSATLSRAGFPHSNVDVFRSSSGSSSSSSSSSSCGHVLVAVASLILEGPKSQWRDVKRYREAERVLEGMLGDVGALEALWGLWVSPLPLAAWELMGALVEPAVSAQASA
uniref:Uncharacterized protein n=1 Tax=Chromera velia CCMP2878 TaxID=1169474 RepID=A0A0G4HX55_9ALVE|eukprot:Cvel_9206.t1-p1 / transcript=Cvel_9206.t1 / gene=Cvel_9206 / organism=Chromera_velia_CCMP2878 / gene_product=hypothetical protein / transcript_product=hypothetical protein / location=Cvel_scaffold524:71297-77026(-) / protein_length=126 / sequence_SO=supercontig / SO=protein_coding / is_pseudo=false